MFSGGGRAEALCSNLSAVCITEQRAPSNGSFLFLSLFNQKKKLKQQTKLLDGVWVSTAEYFWFGFRGLMIHIKMIFFLTITVHLCGFLCNREENPSPISSPSMLNVWMCTPCLFTLLLELSLGHTRCTWGLRDNRLRCCAVCAACSI